jgi:predicted polyphosphate/ATP-dependent NAD kinase
MIARRRRLCHAVGVDLMARDIYDAIGPRMPIAAVSAVIKVFSSL